MKRLMLALLLLAAAAPTAQARYWFVFPNWPGHRFLKPQTDHVMRYSARTAGGPGQVHPHPVYDFRIDFDYPWHGKERSYRAYLTEVPAEQVIELVVPEGPLSLPLPPTPPTSRRLQ